MLLSAVPPVTVRLKKVSSRKYSKNEDKASVHNVRSGNHSESEGEEDVKKPRSGLATPHFQVCSTEIRYEHKHFSNA